MLSGCGQKKEIEDVSQYGTQRALHIQDDHSTMITIESVLWGAVDALGCIEPITQ